MTKEIKLISWNVVSLRNILDKANLAPSGRRPVNFLDWLQRESPDIICFQETKLQQSQLPPALEAPLGYYTAWNFAARKGYSGVATFSRNKPLQEATGLNVERFDAEGRALPAEMLPAEVTFSGVQFHLAAAQTGTPNSLI